MLLDFPGVPVVKNTPASVGDMDLIPVWEHSTCHGPTRPVGHKYCSPHTPEPVLHNTAFAMRSPRTTTESAACLPPLERKPVGSDKDPVQPKINKQIN